THLVIFEKDKESFYYYTYNINSAPDTRMSDSKTNDMILNYNAYKGMKLSFGEGSRVSRINLNIFFNPQSDFISGTTTITYKSPTSLKLLDLAGGLNLVGTLNLDVRGLNVFRKRDRYYLIGPEDDTIALYFRGRFKPGRENFELFKFQSEGEQDLSDREDREPSFYFLSKVHNFYPNPGDEFFKTSVTVTLPGQLNCLASGHLVEKKEGDPVSFKFNSPGSKGISLAAGYFALTRKLDARIPLNFYTLQESRFPRLDSEEIKEGFNFFTQTFGPLDLPGINILLRGGAEEGGVSNNGFIVINYFERKRSGKSLLAGGQKVEKKILCPILLRDRPEDYILHELAHQWWGGVISWKSYRDVWLTEGLSHFSVLYYLKKKMSEKQFNRLIKKIKRWVYRFSDTGPVSYGTRIRALENRYEPFQSVVYNKSALIFLMVLDLIGEKEFNRRLKSVVDEFKYKSIASMQFIRQFCGKNNMLLDFFKKWVYSRTIPEVELELVNDDPAFDAKEYKTVVLSITQLDTDFIFPLRLKVTTQKDSTIEPIIMKEKTQKFIITRDSTIRTINVVEDWLTPVKEKKQPQPRR
ncbi:M1 family metallopeptidase, partial [Acidobacteriota bacterium]